MLYKIDLNKAWSCNTSVANSCFDTASSDAQSSRVIVGPRSECASTTVVTAGARIGMIVFDKKNAARQHGLLWLELAARGGGG